MFEQLAVFLNLVEKDEQDRTKSEEPGVARIDETTIELRQTQSASHDPQSKKPANKGNGDDTLGGLGQEGSGLGQSLEGPKKAARFKFKTVIGPKADSFKLNQAIRQEIEADTLTTLISVGRYYPVMLHLKEVTCVKGQLAYIIHDLQLRSGEEPLVIQTSVFTFNKNELIDLLGTEQSQMLFGFELSYIVENRETVANLTSKILDRCSKKLRERSLNPPSIFFYVTFQIGRSAKQYKYLLCDVYNPYQSSSGTREPAVLCHELQCLLKYISFETPELEILEQEQTSSLDIFFNELVQEKAQRFGVVVCVPVERKNAADAARLIDLAVQLEKASRIFHSYTFRLVQSAVTKVPAILVRRTTEGYESRAPSSRKNSGTFGNLDVERPAEETATKRFEDRFACTFGKNSQKKETPSHRPKDREPPRAPQSVSERLETCVDEMESRLANRHLFIEMQTDLHQEHMEIVKTKLETCNAIIEELDRLLATERYQNSYLKNLVKCIADYKWLKDEQKKAKIILAINELGGVLEDNVVTRILKLLNESASPS